MPAFEIYLFSKNVFTRASASISVIPYTPLLEESWTLGPRITESRPALCQAPVMVLKQQIYPGFILRSKTPPVEAQACSDRQ